MDFPGLKGVLEGMAAGQFTLVARDTTEPSPLAHEVINAKPYAFLDDAPLEERRTQAVITRRGLDVKTAEELGKLDQAAIDRVREEAWPDVSSADELHDALLVTGALTSAVHGRRGGAGGVRARSARPHPSLHARPAAPGNRAGHGGGLHALPVAVAARRTGRPGRGTGRARRGARAARRIRSARGCVGSRRASGPARRIRPVVARRPVSLGGDRLGSAA